MEPLTWPHSRCCWFSASAVSHTFLTQQLMWPHSRCCWFPDSAVPFTPARQTAIRGTIPDAINSPFYLQDFDAAENELSGSIPSALFMDAYRSRRIYLHCNRLTGILQTLKNAGVFTASGNMLEGSLPNSLHLNLEVLDLSGVVGRGRGLSGPLPPAIRQNSHLSILTLANQQIRGGIPSFKSSLSLLALQNNRLKVLYDPNCADNASSTVILLHNNLLSCNVPMRGRTSAKTSLIAIGNRLRYPRNFPAWVLEYERDPLLWTSGADGMCLVMKISGAIGLLVFVVVLKLGLATPLRAMSVWQIGPATHLWVVKAASNLNTCMAIDSAMAAVFIVFLLSWDFWYVCPQTLAILSACSRSGALIRTLVFLCWCKLCFHALAVEHLTMDYEKQKQKKWTAKMLWKRWLLWLVWCVLTVVPFNMCYLVSSRQVRPGHSSSWKECVVNPESCHWGHSRIGGQLHPAISCRQNYVAEACLYYSIWPSHELCDSHCNRHLSRHRMPWKMGVIVEDMPKQQSAVPKTFAMQQRESPRL